MVWTLRFYDESDNQIAYVEKPDKTTYNVSITNSDPKYDDFGTYLRGMKRVSVPEDTSDLDSSEWRVESGPLINQFEPKEHLEKVQEQPYDEIDYTTLQDE